MRKRGVIAPLIVGLIAGSGLTWGASFLKSESPVEREELHLGQKDFINPLVDCPGSPRGMPANKANLQDALNDLIEKASKNGDVQEVAVLYRDLNNGPGLAINAKAPFIAASLLKLPILVAFFKKRDSAPKLFDNQLTFDNVADGKLERQPTIAPAFPPMEGGKRYNVGELLARMIVDSDNFATAMLMKYYPEVDIAQTLRDMGIPISMKGDELWINVEDYAGIFRILYNTTYLGQEPSNSALAMMTQSTFDLGLEAGVEPGVPVAHKFGEREIGPLQQFHDCGIVYYPLRPYLLCVMTRGGKQKALIEVIAAISKTVYNQVKKVSEDR